MGTYGRIEDRVALDIRTFRQRGWLAQGSGVMEWKQGGQRTASLFYQVGDDQVMLDHITRDDAGNPLPVQVRVPMTTAPCRYGGHRHYWLCPHCGRRCEVVLMGWNGRGWGCRVCLRLRYQSQYRLPMYRNMDRARDILSSLGATDPNDPRSAVKPKWMRWATFNRKVSHATRLMTMGCSMMGSRIARLYRQLMG